LFSPTVHATKNHYHGVDLHIILFQKRAALAAETRIEPALSWRDVGHTGFNAAGLFLLGLCWRCGSNLGVCVAKAHWK